MNIFYTTMRAVIKRPFILILVGVLMMAAAIINAIIPVMAMIVGVINMAGGGIFESVLSVLQMMIDPSILPGLLILLAVLAVLVSIVTGLLLPGYLLVVNDGIANGDKRPGLFAKGIKDYFFKFFFMMVKTVLCIELLVVFLMVAAVPAIVVTRAALTTKPELIIGVLFIDFITVVVWFMSLSFFKVYVYMWYIAASKNEKKPFIAGKVAADRQFWSMAFSLLIFDVVFVAIIFLIYLSNSQIFRYVSGWAFTTAFFTTLAVYLVHTYSESSRN